MRTKQTGTGRGEKPSPHKQLSAILASGDKPAIDLILAQLNGIQERLIPSGR